MLREHSIAGHVRGGLDCPSAFRACIDVHQSSLRVVCLCCAEPGVPYWHSAAIFPIATASDNTAMNLSRTQETASCPRVAFALSTHSTLARVPLTDGYGRVLIAAAIKPVQSCLARCRQALAMSGFTLRRRLRIRVARRTLRTDYRALGRFACGVARGHKDTDRQHQATGLVKPHRERGSRKSSLPHDCTPNAGTGALAALI